MRKSKLKPLLAITIVTSILLLYPYLASSTEINVPDNYFSAADINTGNQSEAYFNDYGADGFGFFFLGDLIDVNATLTHQGTTTTCHKQLKGYYTTNYTNFGMFPIDKQTADTQKSLINGLKMNVSGGFYTDCEIGQGVYGYIKWTYGGSAGTNQQEIRAGVTQDGRQQTNSNLQLVSFGENIALSGYIHDSITKNSRIVPNFPEKILIDIPDAYFNNTMAISGNRNEMTFIGSGIDGFGLFFLGTGIKKSNLETPFSITDMQGQELTCLGQINGYYSISLIDFGMFPLDSKTASDYQTDGINYIGGGLYYDCKKGDTNLTGVFGHIKREYLNGRNSKNTHEIRAGINPNGTWKTTSPIELIYSENTRNISRTLSGTYQSSLAKNSRVYSRFFGDAGFSFSGSNINQTGGNNDEYIPIEYSQYKTNGVLLYLKSTKQGTTAKISLTGFDTNGQYVTGFTISNISLSNSRSSFGFYGYYGRNLTKIPRMTSGIVNINIMYDGETRSKNLKFRIENASPIINITKIPSNSCSKEITISATATNDPTTFGYKIINGDSCTEIETGFNDYTGGGIVLNDESYNDKVICFMAANDLATGYNSITITGIDLVGPTTNGNQYSFTGYECSNITGFVDMQDLGQCGNDGLEVNFNNVGFKTGFAINRSWVRFQHIESRDIVSSYTIPFTGKDKAGNQTTGQITMNWINVPVKGKNATAYVEFKNRIMHGEINRKKETQASAGSCETITAEVLGCTKGNGTISGDIFTYEYIDASTTPGRYDDCTLIISDDDGSIKVIIHWLKCTDYNYCKPIIEPEISGGPNFVDWCYSGGYEHGLGLFTFENSVCQYIPETKPVTDASVTKYTSGSEISINTNYSGTLSLKQYRASCIPNTSICTNITLGRHDIGCDDIYSGYFTTLRGCSTRSNKRTDGICGFKQNGDKCCKNWGEIYVIDEYFLGIPIIGHWEPGCTDHDSDDLRSDIVGSIFGNRDLVNCEYENIYEYCRRRCSDSPRSGYFEDVLGCTYTNNTLYGQCISSTSSFFSSNKYKADSQGRCRRCGSNAPIVGTNNINDTIADCQNDWAGYTSGSNVYSCDQMENARTERKDFPSDSISPLYSISPRDLENGSGCTNESRLSPESPYQGQRSVWIQVKDTNNFISDITESDLVIYDKEVTYGTRSPTLTGYSATRELGIESMTLNYSVEVSDTGLFHKIQLTSGGQSSTEQFVTNLFQTRIKPLVLYNISKEVTSLRFMKGYCKKFETKTGIFNAPINNSCTCTGRDNINTCSGDYQDFSDKGLTGRIPAIDFGCTYEGLHRYTGLNVPVEIASGNRNMICSGLSGDKYSECTEYSCDKYDGNNIIECSYQSCTNYGNGCLAYKNEIYTGNTYVDSSCTCIDTTSAPTTGLDPTNYDSNQYRCSVFTGESGEPELECYECITYECIRTTNECQENAYSYGVTYFTINPGFVSYTSHLKLLKYEEIASGTNATTGGIIDLVVIGNDHIERPITGYTWRIRGDNLQRWTNNANISINLRDVPRCLDQDGELQLKINTGLVSDFALNLTNSFIYGGIPYEVPAQKPQCCNCDLSDTDAPCYVECCDENDPDCYCKKYPNDHKCTCDAEGTGNLNCLCQWNDYEGSNKYYDPDDALCKCDEPNPATREYCTCSYRGTNSKNKVVPKDADNEECIQSYCNNGIDCDCNDIELLGPTETGFTTFTLNLTTGKYRNSRGENCVNCPDTEYCIYHPTAPECRCDDINYNCALIKNNTVSGYIAVLTGNLKIGDNGPTNTGKLYLGTATPICSPGGFTCIASESCPGFTCSTGVDACTEISLSPNTMNDCETYYDYNIDFVLQGYEDDDGNPTRYERTGCTITFDAGQHSNGDSIEIKTGKEITVNFRLLTGVTAFMAGDTGSETYYRQSLFQAIQDYSGDNGFFFYISQPQWINLGTQYLQNKGGVLGNITYEIDFSSGVSDQYFYIGGTSIINGYKKELEIKKPTYNYANPKGYLFTFPEYN